MSVAQTAYWWNGRGHARDKVLFRLRFTSAPYGWLAATRRLISRSQRKTITINGDFPAYCRTDTHLTDVRIRRGYSLADGRMSCRLSSMLTRFDVSHHGCAPPETLRGFLTERHSGNRLSHNPGPRTSASIVYAWCASPYRFGARSMLPTRC